MSKKNIEQQRQNFNKLLTQLETADTEEIKNILAQREITHPELELTPDIIDRLRVKIQNRKP